jgi:hypothetical protein
VKFAVGFTVSAREDELKKLATLAGSDDQAAIRRFVRAEAERAVLDHFARRGVNLRVLAGELATMPRPRAAAVAALPRLDENARVVR